MILGAIADDLTGATDLALTLSREGMRTLQVVGVPPPGFPSADEDADAVVVALKSRTIPVADAVAQSLAALERLRAAGVRQIFFKYCSTFDSTPAGNIGPVAEALRAALGGGIAVACPAFPVNGRTVYLGHLFVGRQLLSDSPMKDHPLTPMTSSDLVAVLQAQTGIPVGLVPFAAVDAGAGSIRAALDSKLAENCGFAIVDAVTDRHLRDIGAAVAGDPLVTGGSGVALGLPAAYRARGWLGPAGTGAPFPFADGPGVMLAGSCSTATRRQIVVAIEAGVPALKIDPMAIADGRITPDDAVAFVIAASRAALVYSSDDPAEVRRAQEILGRDRAGAMVEAFHAALAGRLHARGYRRFVVAGGETSGAVVEALGVRAMRIGPEIDPGVPWTTSVGEDEPVSLALKSGNFGAEDFFLKAWTLVT
jgi:uncharacterized protein YgbK (DUF1537 family)